MSDTSEGEKHGSWPVLGAWGKVGLGSGDGSQG